MIPMKKKNFLKWATMNATMKRTEEIAPQKKELEWGL